MKELTLTGVKLTVGSAGLVAASDSDSEELELSDETTATSPVTGLVA
jgi:hypothetical protein